MEPITFQGKIYKVYEGERYYITSGTSRRRLHIAVWESVNGKIPKGYEIHHKDRDTFNNDISNLEIKKTSLHHSEHMKENMKDEGFRNRVLAGLNKAQLAARERHGSDEGMKWHKQHYEDMKDKLYEKTNKYLCIVCGNEFYTNRIIKSRFCSKKCTSQYRRDSGIDNIQSICCICGHVFTKNKNNKILTCSPKCGTILGHRNRLRK